MSSIGIHDLLLVRQIHPMGHQVIDSVKASSILQAGPAEQNHSGLKICRRKSISYKIMIQHLEALNSVQKQGFAYESMIVL